MDKLNDDEIEVVDKIIDFLNKSADYTTDYFVLSSNKLINETNKAKINDLLIHNSICDDKLVNSGIYRLTLNVRQIIYNHATYRKYLDKLKSDEIENKKKQKIKNFLDTIFKPIITGLAITLICFISAILYKNYLKKRHKTANTHESYQKYKTCDTIKSNQSTKLKSEHILVKDSLNHVSSPLK